MEISELPEQFSLITDSYQVTEIRDALNIDMQGCDSLFVNVAKDGGEYEAVYGFEGVIPLLDKTLVPLFTGGGGGF